MERNQYCANTMYFWIIVPVIVLFCYIIFGTISKSDIVFGAVAHFIGLFMFWRYMNQEEGK